ncbi:hypothetical protein C7441_110103 [Pseudaminobacter salicylatoxidans]|uniref:Uncharacterized protein n=1 Tax=Pseudaminobacter salicylatoxidans TaxID=93369 RepID=A0A316C0R9_PSESE|nr:hypothetical protein [Pseudaminobacter salicylatoxidans]PWJ81571.1 hypothetical protein C7441_110103 [Pseudaminobacter salicylatoxidans]
MTYAKNTSVAVSKTEGEIKHTLRRYGASSFASFETSEAAMIAFEMSGRRVVFKLPLPNRQSKEFTETPSGRWARSDKQALDAWEQACRSRWRALFLCIKAKLESVEAGIETFEDAFLAHIQMPDGITVGDHVRSRIASAYAGEPMPPLLLGPAA